MGNGNSKKPVIYSALEVAHICGVVNQTAINWIKAGYLKAFKTPGGQFRVYPEDLISFMIERKMQIPEEILKENSIKLAGGAKTVLIVDDDKGLNTVLAKYFLKKYGSLELFQAFDGFEAGAIMSKEKPGFVVLDLDLPGVDGFSLCHRIKADNSFGHPEIIVITALQDDNIEKRAEDLGIKKVFKKPLNLEEVAASLSEWYSE